jgi:transcriptional regulator with GAF, ATPase, and Fis domain
MHYPDGFFLFVIFLAFMRGTILKQQSEELEAVHTTSLRIAKNEALQPRLEAILDAAVELLNAKGCKVYLKIPNQDALRLLALKGIVSPAFQLGYIMPMNIGLASKVFQLGEPIIENNYQNSPYKVPELAELFEALVEVPLVLDEPIGVIGVFDDVRHRTFSGRDIKVLQRLAQYASIAIRDIQQVDQVQKQRDALQALYLASQALINANLNIDETLTRIVEHVWNLTLTFNELPPLFTYFALLDSQEQFLDFKAAYPVEQLTDLRIRIGRIDFHRKPVGIIAGKET